MAMDPNAKKTALRMIPYGMYVLTAAHADGRVAAATVNWVTQASFEPPLVVVGVKADSGAHALTKATRACLPRPQPPRKRGEIRSRASRFAQAARARRSSPTARPT